ncbi:hypothetical protein KFE80_07915 [bacterium SCSIO 12696]|nr:hypothetical protein KFE80_07915 [bacterium SCSIO 12696]
MIRIAKVEDAGNIAALMVQVWLHTYAKDGIRGAISSYVFSEFTEEKLVNDIVDTKKQCFVAEENKHIVGVSLLNLDSECPATHEKLPELDRLYIQEHFGGMGQICCWGQWRVARTRALKNCG